MTSGGGITALPSSAKQWPARRRGAFRVSLFARLARAANRAEGCMSMMTLYRARSGSIRRRFAPSHGGEMIALFARQWRQQPGLRSRAALCLREPSGALRDAPGLHAEILRHDVKFALRALRHAPAFSLTVILVAATGIGATTAAFSLADHVLIRPLPFRDAEQLVKLSGSAHRPEDGSSSLRDTSATGAIGLRRSSRWRRSIRISPISSAPALPSGSMARG